MIMFSAENLTSFIIIIHLNCFMNHISTNGCHMCFFKTATFSDEIGITRIGIFLIDTSALSTHSCNKVKNA